MSLSVCVALVDSLQSAYAVCLSTLVCYLYTASRENESHYLRNSYSLLQYTYWLATIVQFDYFDMHGCWIDY
jgi:hypothetical protein